MEFLIPFIAIVSGTVISVGFFYMVYKIFQLFVDRKSARRIPEDLKNRLNEMEQNYQYLEKRIRNLEAITAEEDFSPQETSSEEQQTLSTNASSGKKKLVNTLRTKT